MYKFALISILVVATAQQVHSANGEQQQCDFFRGVDAVSTFVPCGQAASDLNAWCTCADRAFAALRTVGCYDATIFSGFTQVSERVCKGELSCTVDRVSQCAQTFAVRLSSSLNDSAACSDFTNFASCVENSCPSIADVAKVAAREAEQFVCANRECDLFAQAGCVYANVSALSQDALCTCASDSLNCGVTASREFRFDSNSIAYGAASALVAGCGQTCTDGPALECIDSAYQCANITGNLDEACSCAGKAKTCLEAAGCLTEEGRELNDKISEILKDVQCKSASSVATLSVANFLAGIVLLFSIMI